MAPKSKSAAAVAAAANPTRIVFEVKQGPHAKLYAMSPPVTVAALIDTIVQNPHKG